MPFWAKTPTFLLYVGQLLGQRPPLRPSPLAGMDESAATADVCERTGVRRGSDARAKDDLRNAALSSATRVMDKRCVQAACVWWYFEVAGCICFLWTPPMYSPLLVLLVTAGHCWPSSCFFASDGSGENFQHRRQTELLHRRSSMLPHGRSSMLTTIGYITQGHWRMPGYLSPPMGSEFAEVPDGLAAILDPVCLAADGDAEDFQRRRQTELLQRRISMIPHGRSSMLATMGCITPGTLAAARLHVATHGLEVR